MNQKFIIQNARSPKGEIEVMGAKNSCLPILAATLLTKEPCVIDNIPLIEDVFKMIKIIEGLGAEVSWVDKRRIKIRCADIDPKKIPFDIVGRFRGSILIVGPLLARFGKVEIMAPGGCLIGARPLDTHLDGFRQMGVNVVIKNDLYFFEKKSGFEPLNQDVLTVSKFNSKDDWEVIFREFSVTATGNLMLYAALEPKKTVLKIADMDYQNQELIKVLNKMGAGAKKAGIASIEIKGAKKIKGFEHKIIPDPIEAGTFIVMALASKGDIVVKKAELSYLDLFLKRLKDFGARFEILSNTSIHVMPSKNMKIDKVQSLPYPGIHTDLQPELGVLATQTKGPTLMHDPLFEGRLKYLEEINKMGGDIIFCDPHRAIVNGPTILYGVEIPSPDLRAGAALLIAGMIARGKTIIDNIYQIDRGYERIEERLGGLGVDIKRVNE
ncbi:MAG: UDP-N-acetylglucosamine 1-carboxyvinyltransferase [Candidatus Nealsonbacteria bacterium]|nr:UDP-N-acetylglucosamine 1-carboxyvinyltransferase [Candidatus Nealsonbacteria bacterium]